ncbi:GGDEF domain-containing protein [Dechloromonas denitrificans]|uniref:GGDEF domain-containing protein n=1 Tax=Dechloromonas denitrificans TaxID=281362 RepID=UPI001CFA30F6|nr:GGDEF domain-containing protein [Dechloromonas denitrificans]UCV09521.1 diguanylate cyclase [Dechloromonas denitrificans]
MENASMAQGTFADQAQTDGAADETDPQRLLHELRVHQIELESQNDELHCAQDELEASRQLYFDLYDLAPVGYCTLSDSGQILQANLTAATLLGVARDDLVMQQIGRFILPNEHDSFLRHSQQMSATGEQHSCDLRMVKKDGTTFWAHLHSLGIQGTDGKRVCRIALTDISERKLAEEALHEQKEFFHLIADNLSDFIAVLDLDGRRLYNSPSYQQIFGTKDLRDTNAFVEIHPDDRERVQQAFRKTVQTGVGSQIEFRFLMTDGSIRDMESRGSVIRDRQGNVIRVVVVSQDITERKQLQEQVRQMAFHDLLTRLPNRRLFNDRLSQAMAASARSFCHGALMFIDLDNFKPLNDAHGHDVGDLLLIEAADRLKHNVREMDTVARFGGDEFVVMLGQMDQDKAESIAQAGVIAEKLRAAMAEPYRLTICHEGEAERTIYHCCAASIGVTLFNQHDASLGGILKRADAAMYRAKQAGGNQIRFSAAPA